MVDPVDGVSAMPVAGQVLGDAEGALRLAVHEQLQNLNAEGSDTGPSRK